MERLITTSLWLYDPSLGVSYEHLVQGWANNRPQLVKFLHLLSKFWQIISASIVRHNKFGKKIYFFSKNFPVMTCTHLVNSRWRMQKFNNLFEKSEVEYLPRLNLDALPKTQSNIQKIYLTFQNGVTKITRLVKVRLIG